MASDDAPAETAASVTTSHVVLGPIEAELRASATIEAERMVTVHAESTGRIVDLAVEEGDAIEAGSLLGRVRADAQASGLDRAVARLDQARADRDHLERLLAQGAAARQEVDGARVTFEQARLDVADRRRDLGNTRLVAPLRGTVTERVATEGGYVTSGTAIATIVDFDSLVARVYVPEHVLDSIAVGQRAEVFGAGGSPRRCDGRLARIAPVVDARTGTVKVTVALPPVTEVAHGFVPGMYAEVVLTTQSRKAAKLVPKLALVRDDDDVFVFVVDGDRVRRTRVELGLIDDEHAEVLAGLVVGDEIVEAGHAGLADGALVERVAVGARTGAPDEV